MSNKTKPKLNVNIAGNEYNFGGRLSEIDSIMGTGVLVAAIGLYRDLVVLYITVLW